MKATRAITALALTSLLACWCGSAQAFRPFDGTDAAVMERGEVEIELGPAEYLREGAGRVLLAPELRANYGFMPNWEATIEGEVAHALTDNVRGTSLVGNAASLKGVLREGSLQQKSGPSIATEFAVLLPGIRDEHGAGVSLTGIVSRQWGWATVHFNAAAALTREQHGDLFLDAIIEGPHGWAVRPVCEFFYQRDFGQFQTRSGLVGAIWQIKDTLAVDFAVRGARINNHSAGAIRAGVTFAFGVAKRSGLLPDLAAAIPR
jgi:hypothetical protein